MKRCEWCERPTTDLNSVTSLGTMYKVCNKCKEAHESETCIKCGESVIGAGSIKGKCYACSQEEYEEKQRRADEVAAGVDMDLMDFYTSDVEFTEEDYERWVTFSQVEITPEERRRRRQMWITEKLTGHNGWTPQLLAKYADELEELVARYIAKLITNKYTIVYYDSKNKKQRIRQFVDCRGKVFVIEVKKKA